MQLLMFEKRRGSHISEGWLEMFSTVSPCCHIPCPDVPPDASWQMFPCQLWCWHLEKKKKEEKGKKKKRLTNSLLQNLRSFANSKEKVSQQDVRRQFWKCLLWSDVSLRRHPLVSPVTPAVQFNKKKIYIHRTSESHQKEMSEFILSSLDTGHSHFLGSFVSYTFSFSFPSANNCFMTKTDFAQLPTLPTFSYFHTLNTVAFRRSWAFLRLQKTETHCWCSVWHTTTRGLSRGRLNTQSRLNCE